MDAERLEPGLLRVRADNPSPMTGSGTNTYIIGEKAVCIIDPGPYDPAHFRAICANLPPGSHVHAILVTHSHKDHSALAPRLSAYFGAPVMAFGPSQSGRSALMQRLAEQGLSGGGEGVDGDFHAHHHLSHESVVHFAAEQLTALWTPGHMGNHMCFLWRDVGFTGDHVMGWSTSLISPPDGDMRAFLASLTVLENHETRVLLPGHGAEVTNPRTRIAQLRDHRLARETQILDHLSREAATIPTLVRAIYTDLPKNLGPAAARNVHAHLISLWEDGRVTCEDLPSEQARYSIS